MLRKDARLREWYKRIRRRRGSTIARVAVMRKLATIIWHMLSTLTVRNSHQINPHLPGPLPGRAAHGYRERYLAKECVGSNRVGKERLQLPASDDNRDESRKRDNGKNAGMTATNEPEEGATTPGAPLRSNPEENRFRLTNSFRNA